MKILRNHIAQFPLRDYCLLAVRLYVAAVLFSVVACRDNLKFSCKDTVLSQQKSPSEEYTATLVERDCGATTDFSRIVTLQETGKTYTDQSNIIFVVKGDPELKLIWQSSKDLAIVYTGESKGKIFRQLTNWRNVTIRY